MKLLLTVTVLLCALTCISQNNSKISSEKARPYFMASAGTYKFEKQGYIGQGSLSVGTTLNVFSFGVGAGYAKFKNDSKAYVPVFAELTIIPVTKVSPFAQARAGWGIYNNTQIIGAVTSGSKGNLYLEFRGGVSFGDQKVRMNVGAGYIRQTFKNFYPGQNPINNSINGFTLFISLKV